MLRPYFLRGLLLAGAAMLASCGQTMAPPALTPVTGGPGALGRSIQPNRCYNTPQHPQTVTATITFYGWPDNSPPGNGIAHPVIHQVASGSGTWCDPTTFATETSNNRRIPYGIKIYLPFLQQYFVREDDCVGCTGLWFDEWVGGTKHSNMNKVLNCENTLTPNGTVSVILYPKSNMPVKFPGPLYTDNPPPNGTCYGMPG
jgi:hypothetical protein